MSKRFYVNANREVNFGAEIMCVIMQTGTRLYIKPSQFSEGFNNVTDFLGHKLIINAAMITHIRRFKLAKVANDETTIRQRAYHENIKKATKVVYYALPYDAEMYREKKPGAIDLCGGNDFKIGEIMTFED